MSSETQLTVSRFAEWLDRVVAHGNWQAEADFIVATLIIHSDAGTRRLTREQYMQSVLSTRTADWRLAIDDLMAYGDRVGCVFKHRDAPSVRGLRSSSAASVLRALRMDNSPRFGWRHALLKRGPGQILLI